MAPVWLQHEIRMLSGKIINWESFLNYEDMEGLLEEDKVENKEVEEAYTYADLRNSVDEAGRFLTRLQYLSKGHPLYIQGERAWKELRVLQGLICPEKLVDTLPKIDPPPF